MLILGTKDRNIFVSSYIINFILFLKFIDDQGVGNWKILKESHHTKAMPLINYQKKRVIPLIISGSV